MAMLAAGPGRASERVLLTQMTSGSTPSTAGNLRTPQKQATSHGRVKAIVGVIVQFAPEGGLALGERATLHRDIASAGTGLGTVNITTPRGTTVCNADCSLPVAVGSVVKFTARAAKGSRFSGRARSGCGRGRPCTIAMSGTVAVTATFTAQ